VGTYGYEAKTQIEGTSSVVAGLTLTGNRNDGLGPYFVLGRSRGTTAGSSTAVQNGDELGTIQFCGADGTDLETAGALIRAEVDGTPGANDMPGRLVFSTTADGASSPTERLRITSAGLVGIGTSSPGANLEVFGDTADVVLTSVTNNNATGANKSLICGVGGATAFSIAPWQNSGFIDSATTNGLALGASSSTGSVRLYTGTSRSVRAIIDSSGNVGIGTTSPGAELDVRGGANVGDGTTTVRTVTSGGVGFVGTSTNHPLSFRINNGEVVRIDTSGRLLVGTSTSLGDGAQVQSVSAIAQVFDGYNFREDNVGSELRLGKARGGSSSSPTILSSGDSIGRVIFRGHAGATSGFLQAAYIDATVDGTPGTNDMPGRLVFSTTADGASSPTERLRITSAGLVGIGVSAPGAILDVAPDANRNLQVQGRSGTTYGLEIKNGTANSAGEFHVTAASSGSVVINRGTTEIARFTSTGLGIGTTSPQEELHIASASQPYIQVQSTGGVTGSAYYGYNSSTGSASIESTGSIRFAIPGSEAARIDSSGRLLVGTSTNDSYFGSKFQIAAGNGEASSLLTRFSANASGPVIFFGKSRSATVGTKSLVSDGDTLGGLEFYGSGAANWQLGAKIEAQVDGTPESGGDTSDMPGRLVFSTTADGASSPTERMRITSAGNVGIGTTSPGNPLDVSGLIRANDSSSDGNAGLVIATDSVTRGYIGTAYLLNGGSETDIGYRVESGNNHIWMTGAAERARIDADGRLLVGTSSNLAPDGFGSKLQIAATDFTASLVLRREENNGSSPNLIFAKTRSGSLGGATIVNDGDVVGNITFYGADGTDVDSMAALIKVEVDGTPGANDMPGRLVFSTTADGASSPTERMRINAAGALKASLDGTYEGATGSYHELRTNGGNDWIAYFTQTTATGPNGVVIRYSAAAPNNTGNTFLYCEDNVGVKATIRSNGGIANFSANDVNLSDINSKKDISPAVDTWDCIKEWEIVNYRYKDQPDDADLNLGVIAQQVAESCPEVITVFEEAKDDQPERLGVKEQQMYWMAIKALQEAQVRIEQLEAAVTALQQS
jgi:hypothetical protein